MKKHLVFVASLMTSYAMSMESVSTSHPDASPTSYATKSNHQLQLIQQIYAALDIEKSEVECQKILALAKRRDRRATMIYRYHGIPLSAPWRDNYMDQVRAAQNPTAQVAVPTISFHQMLYKIIAGLLGLTSTEKKPCAFCEQFSKPDEYEKRNIYHVQEESMDLLNANPYTPILHGLGVPRACADRWENLSEKTRYQLLANAQEKILKVKELGIDSAQIFLNLLDVCAGKSIDHAHLHFLPRIPGDTSAIASLVGEAILKSERQKLTPAELRAGKRKTLWYAIKNWNPQH